ncbi:MAG: hypothetical protein IH897_08105 [Planctomycetes bacterium]|nr:hypothetical protein [Planctomycetota bacterium]
MKRATVTLQTVLCMLTTTALLMAGGTPEFEMTRSTIDGGGVMRSTGEGYELSGSIGQPDAGTMTGGGFELAGGLWFGLAAGDCNEDGLVSLFDHETFTSCLLGPGGGIGASPCPCFDVDRDGDITLNDYAHLQAGFTGQ